MFACFDISDPAPKSEATDVASAYIIMSSGFNTVGVSPVTIIKFPTLYSDKLADTELKLTFTTLLILIIFLSSQLIANNIIRKTIIVVNGFGHIICSVNRKVNINPVDHRRSFLC